MSSTAQADLRSILANLQDEIRRHSQVLDRMGVSERPDPLAKVRQHQWINSHWPLGRPEMPKGVVPKARVYAQRFIRRLMRWYINPLFVQQNSYNTAAVEAMDRLNGLYDEALERFREMEAWINQLQQRITQNQKSQQQQWAAGQAQHEKLAEGLKQIQQNQAKQPLALEGMIQEREQRLQKELSAMQEQLERLQAQFAAKQEQRVTTTDKSSGPQSQFDPRVGPLQEQLRQLEAQIKPIKQERAVLRLRLQRLENSRRTQAATTPDIQDKALKLTTPPPPAVDYFLWGSEYRNDEQMRIRLKDYDDIFSSLAEAQGKVRGPTGPVLDIGCGRGEFVGHLLTLGLSAYGVDLDVDSVHLGQTAGLDIRQEDAYAHLTSLADNSLAGVALIQVIEHFDMADVVQLFQIIARKLAPGGVVVAETINPVCLWALSNWYLMDPSHRTPVHPQTAKFLLEQAGLWQVQIRYLHPVEEGDRLTLVPASEQVADLQGLVQRFNRNIEHLNQFLFGYQDYAAVAFKHKE